MNAFCCTTGYAFFDVWAIVHLAFWVFVGSTLWALHANKQWALAGSLGVSFVWEIIEHFMAPAHPEVWKDMESWWNSWLSDPLMCVVGVLGIWWLLDHRK